MEDVNTDDVASSPAPLAPGIRTDNLVFLSGQIPRTPEGEIVTGDIKEQTSQVFENISAILDEAGLSLEDVVKATVFLTDRNDFADFNEVYRDYLSEPFPSRSAVIVDLAREEIDVEIEVIAED